MSKNVQSKPKAKSTQKLSVLNFRVQFVNPAPLSSEKDTYSHLVECGKTRDVVPWFVQVPELGISTTLVINGKDQCGYLNQPAALQFVRELIMASITGGDEIPFMPVPILIENESTGQGYVGKIIGAIVSIPVLSGLSA